VLAHFFAEKFGLKLTDAGVGYLQDLDWPGNIRELQNTLQMATTAAAKDGPVTSEQLRVARFKANPPSDRIVAPVNEIIPKLNEGQSLKQIIDDFEAHVFREAYARYKGKLPKIVHVSGMSRNTVRTKLVAYGIHEGRGQDERDE